MKKFFQALGLLTLMIFGFFYTEKTALVVKNLDKLMITIKEQKDTYKIEPINAIINDNTIIPGISGKEVNLNKSYKAMKKLGDYNPTLLEYNNIKPDISLKDSYNKYIISGNDKKKEVTLIFKVDDDNIDNILKILKENEINANFFIDGNWFENNNDLVISLIKEGHNVGNISYNLDYKNNGFLWMNTIINKIGNQKNNYCYNEINNEENLNICALAKSYTIKPNLVIKNNPLIEIKDSLRNGSIISMDINSSVEKELPLIIKYIKSKDLKIVNLQKLIEE